VSQDDLQKDTQSTAEGTSRPDMGAAGTLIMVTIGVALPRARFIR